VDRPLAFTDLGSVELELIQPLTGRSIWADFLAEHRQGIHHFRLNVAELDPVLSYLAGPGIGVAQVGSGLRPGITWANLETET
jgi:methylmalonyl-CoA/ethylmalonyl-CoA epimerase